MKQNRKGFTLIELLAVITIMGILMLVAIPAVSRTIENTRRQTFANTALQYIKSFKNEVYQDQVSCGSKKPSALGPGYYYYYFDSSNSTGRDLMEQGGTSSWGGSQVKGIITMYKPSSVFDNTHQKSDIEYAIFITDSVGRGIGEAYPNYNSDPRPRRYVTEKSITRSTVSTKNSNYRKEWFERSTNTYSKPENAYNNNANYFEGSLYESFYDNWSGGTGQYININTNGVSWTPCSLSS